MTAPSQPAALVQAPPAAPAARDDFLDWVRGIPKTFKVLTAAATAAVAFFAPALPEPLRGYSPFAAFMVVVAFLLTWAWRQTLARRVRLVSSASFALLIVLIVLQMRYVRPVPFGNETDSFLTAGPITNPDACGASYEVAIRQCGGDWAALESIWGRGYYQVAVIYGIAYVLFCTGVLLSLGGTRLAQPR
ncbi:MAG TPA: hypothetical protein VGB15_12780 [Longimicrobium sp.]|jgi:hypothetical protein